MPVNDADLEGMLVESKCTRTVHRYAQAADSDDVALFLDCFTPDARWERPDSGVLCGHAALRSFYTTRPTWGFSRHLVTNVFVELVDASRAKAVSMVTVLKLKPATERPVRELPLLWLGRYDDEFALCADGQWRIAHRRVTLELDRSAAG